MLELTRCAAAASGTTFYTLAFGVDILAQLILFMYLARLFSIETFGRYALLTVAGMMLVALPDGAPCVIGKA